MWGVDSYNSADHQVRVPRRFRAAGDPERQTLFEFLHHRVGRTPDFWGRYLNTYASGLVEGEVTFLHGHNCKILLVFNGPRQPLTGAHSYQGGLNAANAACLLARRVGAPAGVRIYADLEGWAVDPDWLRGWFTGMWQSEYAGMGGLYGRGAEISRHGGTPWHPRRVWATSASTAIDQELDDVMNQSAGGQRISKEAVPYVWSNMPRSGGDPPLGHGSTEGVIPTSFGAVGPSSLHIQTHVWQYRLNCPLGTSHPLVDMDMATDAGFADMW